jgi:adenylate kinase family enzyme
MTNARRTIVTGLACSGKSTLAQKLSPNVLVCDHYRYGPGWVKRDPKDYVASVLARVADQPNLVIEGALHDAHDPMQARERAFKRILEFYPGTRVYVVLPKTMHEQVADIVKRSIGRAKGEVPQGTCPETSESVAKLLVKTIQNYEENVRALEDFSEWCINNEHATIAIDGDGIEAQKRVF